MTHRTQARASTSMFPLPEIKVISPRGLRQMYPVVRMFVHVTIFGLVQRLCSPRECPVSSVLERDYSTLNLREERHFAKIHDEDAICRACP